MSATDLQVIALTYELECEVNHGDWRLRREPGQKSINGPVPQRTSSEAIEPEQTAKIDEHKENINSADNQTVGDDLSDDDQPADDIPSDDDQGWITPETIDQRKGLSIAAEQRLQVACITDDYAMQNVLLQIGLNLVNSSGRRIRQVKSYVLRCHACFHITRDMNKKFCPECGNATLLRTSCSTDEHGKFNIYLKKNMQWSTRGQRYPIPKPVHGTSSGKQTPPLILRSDQKEWIRAEKKNARAAKKIDLDDPDWIPDLVTGKSKHNNRSAFVGSGSRDPNARRRRKV